MKRFILSVLLLFQVVLFATGKNSFVFLEDTVATEDYRLTWFDFRWMSSSDYYNLEVEKAHIIVDVRFDNLHEKYPMYLRLMAPENTIYSSTKTSMIWHFPTIEKLIDTRQAAGRTVVEHFPRIDVRFGEPRLTLNNASFRVIADPVRTFKATQTTSIAGAVSSSIFQNVVLFIDFPEQRMSFSERIPYRLEERGRFVDFEYVLGYITIPIIVDDRDHWFWLSGDSPPAVEIYNKRLYDRIISQVIANDSLLVYNANNEMELVGGFMADEDFYFRHLKLKKNNLYFVDKGRTRFDRKRIIGTISMNSFFDYIMVIDYKNQRFGLIPKE